MEEILLRLAIPRPDHGSSVDAISLYIRDLLQSWKIAFTQQDFVLRPHNSLIVGLAMLILAVLIFYFLLKKKPVLALIAGLMLPALLFVESEFQTPILSWLYTKPGHNIIVNYPVAAPVRELIFLAHYDSKTDLFDHVQRRQIFRWVPPAICLGFLLPLISLLGKRFEWLRGRSAKRVISSLAAVLILFWSIMALALGGYVLPQDESPGVIDNATAVTLLLQLTREIHEGKIDLGQSNITIVFTGGEEVGIQGANAYVKERLRAERGGFTLPASLVNLEAAGQNGNLSYSARNGIFFKFYETDHILLARLNKVWGAISGQSIEMGPDSVNDAVCFQAAGIPSIRLGNTGLPGMGMGGFHKPTDNLSRVNWDNMITFSGVLREYVQSYNRY